jgi:hypothetical protein
MRRRVREKILPVRLVEEMVGYRSCPGIRYTRIATK